MFSLVGYKFMSEMHIRQQGVIYKTFEPFTKHKEIMKK